MPVCAAFLAGSVLDAAGQVPRCGPPASAVSKTLDRQTVSPPRDVRWGEETTDEMCIAFVRVTVDAEQLGYRPP